MFVWQHLAFICLCARFSIPPRSDSARMAASCALWVWVQLGWVWLTMAMPQGSLPVDMDTSTVFAEQESFD